MNAPQENKLSMYLTVKTVCDGAAAVWTPIPAFATNYATFIAQVRLIQQLAAAQASDRSGATRNKSDITETLADSVLAVAGALTAFATVQNDETLKSRVDFPRSSFLGLRDVEMAGTAELVLAEATSRLPLLADYGLTAAKLATFEDQIDAYAAIAEAPRSGIAGRKTITAQIAEEFQKADAVLKDVLDRLLQQFKTSNPSFYNDYTNARTIVDRPGGLGSEEVPANTPAPAPLPQPPA